MENTKATRRFYLRTPYGNAYYIHDSSAIERADMADHHGSESWTFNAIVTVRGRYVVGFTKLDEWLATSPALLFKNGKPRYTVRDVDHGTSRTWGNTDHHGIADLRRVS